MSQMGKLSHRELGDFPLMPVNPCSVKSCLPLPPTLGHGESFKRLWEHEINRGMRESVRDPSSYLQEGPRRRMGFGFSFFKVPSYRGNSEMYLHPSARLQGSEKCRLAPGSESPALFCSSCKPHWAEQEEGRGLVGRGCGPPSVLSSNGRCPTGCAGTRPPFQASEGVC